MRTLYLDKMRALYRGLYYNLMDSLWVIAPKEKMRVRLISGPRMCVHFDKGAHYCAPRGGQSKSRKGKVFVP